MRSIRAPRPHRSTIRLLIPLLLLAACAGAETAAVARPHEMRLSIVGGRGLVDTVRTPGLPAGAEQLVAEPVVARVHVVLDEDAGTPITEPGREVRLPPVTIRWRTLQTWCDVLADSSALAGGATAQNQYHRPIHALPCQLVAEGLVDGQVFDADTATILFKPGPAVTFEVTPVLAHMLGQGTAFHRGARYPRDVYGNYILEYTVAGQLTSGSPPFVIQDTLVRSPVEAAGTLRLTVGSHSEEVQVWALTDLRAFWRLEWACYGLPAAEGGVHVDSVHHRLDGGITYGPTAFLEGIFVRVDGTLTTRQWDRGQPLRETTATGHARFAAQRPGVLAWSPGQEAHPTATGYAGGNLCTPLADGRAWTGFTPARMERR